MHLRVLCISALLALLLVACATDENTDESPVLGTLEETLQIGSADAPEKEASLFGRISQIAVDEAGTIYVAEGQAHEIRVFNEQGDHLDTFGRSGEGPGEFQAITAMTVDQNGRLVVADPSNGRISIIAPEGKLLESHTSPITNPVRQIRELPNGQFLLVGLHNDHLVHLVDADFEAILAHLVPVSEILYTEDPLERKMWLPRMPGHAVAVSDDRIVYAPSIYGGQLYVYEKGGSDDWSRTHTVEASPVESPPVTPVENGEEATFAMPDGRALQVHSLTSGLFPLKDGRLIHVFSRQTEEGVTFQAGTVSAEGTYEGHLQFPERTYEEHFSLRAFATDANNRLYLADDRDYPLVRRMGISREQ